MTPPSISPFDLVGILIITLEVGFVFNTNLNPTRLAIMCPGTVSVKRWLKQIYNSSSQNNNNKMGASNDLRNGVELPCIIVTNRFHVHISSL